MGWIIDLAPQFNTMPSLTLSVTGDTLTICGEDLDLSAMDDGDWLDAEDVDSPYINDRIEKAGGMIHIRLLFPLRYGAGEAARFPDPITVTADGPVALPANGDPA